MRLFALTRNHIGLGCPRCTVFLMTVLAVEITMSRHQTGDNQRLRKHGPHRTQPDSCQYLSLKHRLDQRSKEIPKSRDRREQTASCCDEERLQATVTFCIGLVLSPGIRVRGAAVKCRRNTIQYLGGGNRSFCRRKITYFTSWFARSLRCLFSDFLYIHMFK